MWLAADEQGRKWWLYAHAAPQAAAAAAAAAAAVPSPARSWNRDDPAPSCAAGQLCGRSWRRRRATAAVAAAAPVWESKP